MFAVGGCPSENGKLHDARAAIIGQQKKLPHSTTALNDDNSVRLHSLHSIHPLTGLKSAAKMQSTRMLGSNMLRASQPLMRQRAAMQFLRPQQSIMRTLRMQASPVLRSPVPKEEHAAHTISQRLRQLKKVPVELWPLFVVLAVAIVAAGYSLARKLYVDRTLRLYRQGKKQ
ncbi:hypothetical protein AMS68_002856 [Peltaster fructicola]|uniref:Uncharacterized protein n=1 Tax=Peltaster fructicola TaxID=286661 RepID=A0A6H0XRT5_9PEZI|nr:hypothetical protein AMS68_002856 [Peltaster fructicola]